MKPYDYTLEQHFKKVAERPAPKGSETITTFDRDVFWYDRDEVARQAEISARAAKQETNYEDHRRVIETAINMMRKSYAHEIAMCILTHRHFADYRAKTFAGLGGFKEDYSFILKKIEPMLNHSTGQVIRSSIATKLREYEKPTLVQLNHIVGEVSKVTVPDGLMTLNEWAVKFNAGAPESTTYMVAGLKVG